MYICSPLFFLACLKMYVVIVVKNTIHLSYMCDSLIPIFTVKQKANKEMAISNSSLDEF